MFRKKFGREKETKFLSGMDPLTFPKLKSKESVKELLVRKVRKLMQAWFTLKGKYKRIRCYSLKELKLFAVKLVL